MTHPTSHTSPDSNNNDFNLSHIFIGREQQLDLFDIYLTRWKTLIFNDDLDLDTLMMAAPSPNNKLQGLVVLLYGHGGFGKSTLLKRYRDAALEERYHITVSALVNWEFAVEGKRSLFNPPPGQEIDAPEYYRVLCGQLAIALDKSPKDFRTYQTAVKNVEKARKQASGVLDRMQNDDRYAALRGLTIDALSTLMGTVIPTPFDKIVGNEKVKGAVNEGVKVGAELIAQVHTKLRDALGNKLGDYLDAPTRLGLALGRDLHTLAQNFPLLILFDTYEEIDTADRLLRIVMGAAGLRVGWVLAGRDNLWGGSEQRKRSIAKEYGYKDIVLPDRCLAVDFSVGGVGAFTLNDIQDYFDQVCHRAHYEPPLLSVTEEQAERILHVTLGVPLAVSIAAGLYVETANLEQVTETLDSQRNIVDQMVERYLLHARDDQSERLKLYGLALLRRPDLPFAVAAALGLSEEDAKTNYERELSRLHRRYSFIFTEKVQPSLHQEVRYFLRLQLLEHRSDPEIATLTTQLKDVHEAALKQLEAHRQYTTLQERLQDDEWIGVYLDLTEQQFWLDPIEGVRYLLPFMIAAAIYRRDLNEDAVELGAFFVTHIRSQYRHWWVWATQSLIFTTSRYPSDGEVAGLQHLVQLAEQHSPTFPPFLPESRRELEAALWWRLGEAYRDRDETKAFAWYEKAL